MKSKLLTIAISEMKVTTFKVITYDLNEQKFKPVIVKSDQFIVNEQKAWDLFGITESALTLSRLGFYFPQGNSEVVDYYDKPRMIKFFEKNKTLSPDFINKTNPYGIVAADQISEIYPPRQERDQFSSYIGFTSRNKHYPRVRIKDLRWLSYWKHAHQVKPHEITSKIDHWRNYLNNPKKQRFLILFYSADYQRSWICGFHCL